MTRHTLVAAMSFVLVFAACARKSVDTNVCALAKTPDAFNGKTVTVRAGFESDGLHWTILRDPSCRDAFVTVTWSDGNGDRGIHDLIDRVYSKAQHPGTLDKDVTGFFIGVFHWDKTEEPRQRLDVLEVHDVVIQQRPDSPFVEDMPSAPETRER